MSDSLWHQGNTPIVIREEATVILAAGGDYQCVVACQLCRANYLGDLVTQALELARSADVLVLDMSGVEGWPPGSCIRVEVPRH